MAASSYNSKVRIGNWYETQADEQERSAESWSEGGELAKIEKLLSESSRKITLTARADNIVRYGDQTMLRHTAANRVLSACFSEHVPSPIMDTVAVTASEADEPVSRSVFTIVPYSKDGKPDERMEDRPLCYGEKFVLQTQSLDGEPLCLFTERASLSSGMAQMSGKQAAALKRVDPTAGKPVPYGAAWEAVYIDQEERMEREGLPVMAGHALLLRSCGTAGALATLQQFVVPSEHGLECEVVCHTYTTKFKNEGPENGWQLQLGAEEPVD